MTQHLLIVNPVAGGGRKIGEMDQLVEWARRYLPDTKIIKTLKVGHATEIAKEWGGKCKVCITLGGDGTFNEVVNGIALLSQKTRPKLALLPMGTGGDFSRVLQERFHIPKDLSWLPNAQTVEVDIGQALFDGDLEKKRYFINVADAGLAGEVVRQVNARKKKWGALEYPLATIRAAWNYKSLPVKVEGLVTESGQVIDELDVMIFVVANGRYFGGGMCIGPDAVLDDGIFQIIAADRISYLALIGQLPRVYRHKRFNHPKVYYGTGDYLTLISQGRPLPLDLDGEYFEAHRVEFRVLTRYLQILVAGRGNSGG